MTECNQDSFEFEELFSRQVVARFDGGTISSDAKVREAPEPGYVTNHVTNSELSGLSETEVIEENGRHVGTRTPDLYRVKVAL